MKDTELEAEALFRGGGELGSRMAQLDWSKTSLGPVSVWPQSLKTAVRIMLTSSQPMFVWWGPELINLYNDAYKSIVAGKHPQALGQPASVVWREIWSEVEPRARKAIERNEGTYDEALQLLMERSGYREETYYTFSYSPVPDDQGRPGGIFCANTDDTQRIVGARQLALLQELASRLADARTLEEASRLAVETLHGPDVTFGLLYVRAGDDGPLRLAGASGLKSGHEACPEQLLPGHLFTDKAAQALTKQEFVGTVDISGISALPLNTWDEPSRLAAVASVPSAGELGVHAVLIVGLNPYRLFDTAYQDFVRLLAGQVGASFANAQAYEEEKKRAEALAELDRAKTTFFSNISHEFRTPLTLMLGPTEEAVAREPALLEGPDLEAVYRNQLRLLKLVNALLDFSRLEAGRMQACYSPTDLGHYTTELAGMFRSAIERAGLRFIVDCPDGLDPVYIDPAMWEKIVLNLLSNALKFTFEGSISVSLEDLDETVRVSFSDTGIGVEEHQLPHLFERFHRVEGSRSRTHEGSGIGLALVLDLVKLHGGKVTAQSVRDSGTTITIELRKGSAHLPPDRLASEAVIRPDRSTESRAFVQEALSELAPSNESSEEHIKGRPLVLLADDNADMRAYISRVLKPHFNVRAVEDGQAALKAVEVDCPDLVLTDVMMPRLDGFELLKALRSDPRTHTLPVIMLSARAGEESRTEGLEAGADDYLVKPFAARELLARVEGNLELSRLRAQNALERSSFFKVFQQAPIPIAVLEGPDFHFELANDAYHQVIGREDQPIEGKALLDVLPEIEGQGILELLQDVRTTGEPYIANELHVRLSRSDNPEQEKRYFTFIYSPLERTEAKDRGAIVIATEVTAQVHARENMQRLAGEAQAANQAKDEFLAMLGHELRNPLSPILTALELFKLKGEESRELAVINRQVGHLVRLVDDLLDVSRIAQGKVVLNKQTVELSELVQSAVETAAPLFDERRQTLHLSVPKTGLKVDADVGRMVQVIANLLTNAAKYSGPETTVWVKAEQDRNCVHLSVEDEGCGIEPEMLKRIFHLFTQQKQTLDRSRGGLGLGLSIVKSLISLHQGTVRAESDGPGHGSRFIVELPLTEQAERTRVRESLKPEPISLKILLVDDNRDAADTLSLLLESLGYEVETAHDGPAALSAAKQFEPNVVLLDLGLPVMDGFEVARRLREEKNSPHLIAVTGYGQSEDRGRTAKAGFGHHLVKPVSLRELRAALDEAKSLLQNDSKS